jgi:hypothetical protein
VNINPRRTDRLSFSDLIYCKSELNGSSLETKTTYGGGV